MNLLLPSPGYKAEREEPQSAVAMHEMEPGWVMDRLWGWGDPEPPWIHVSRFLQRASIKRDRQEEWFSVREPECTSLTADTSSVGLGKLSTLSVSWLSHL